MNTIKEPIRIKQIMQTENVKYLLENKHCNCDIDDLICKYKSFNQLQKEVNDLICLQKKTSIENAKLIKHQIKDHRDQLSELAQDINNIMDQIPNIPHITVPIGPDEKHNVVIKTNGELVHKIDHYDLVNVKNYNDVSGTRFYYTSGNIAKLERALANFMIEYLLSNGFQEYSLPSLVKNFALERTRHLPKDQDNMFSTNNDLWLIPTTEVSLMNLFYKQTIDQTHKVCAISECFRKEAGSAGKDTKGLIRLHQFKKCEMVVFTQEDESYKHLEDMVDISCQLLRKLKIPHRVVLLCTGDMPFSAAKCYDIEVPIGNQWREVASISNCTNFQTITMGTKTSDGKYAHSLNGSALPIGRTLASFLEVHYNPSNNSIELPECLYKYFDHKVILLS